MALVKSDDFVQGKPNDFVPGSILQRTLTLGINRLSLRSYSTPAGKEKEAISSPEEDKFVNEKRNNENPNRPSQQQLEHVYNTLADDVRLFKKLKTLNHHYNRM